MPTPIYAWASPPSLNQLAQFLHQHPEPKQLIIGLPENRTIDFALFNQSPPATETQLHTAWRHAFRYIQFQAANFISHFYQENTHLWLIPHQQLATLNQYHFTQIHWQDTHIPQQTSAPIKPWYQRPQANLPNHVLIIGAGIAGAATAHELAIRGIKVTILEAHHQPAQAASGNYQGLLYAKISPYPTAQTELLLAGYGYTRRLLDRLLPQQQGWGACGVIHLNHNPSETKRNQKLAQHTWHQHLYQPINAQQASQLAGIPIQQDGLYWPHGVWINPATLIHTLLKHPNIQLHTNSQVHHINHQQQWHIQTTQGKTFSGSHLIFCVGAQTHTLPIIQQYPTQQIRGQTSIAQATPQSKQLKTALSAASYISPAWQEQQCFGATFIHHDNNTQWQLADEQANQQALKQLSPWLYQTLINTSTQAHLPINHQQGHAALRCDSHDHLPIIGALGNVPLMQQIYAKLALDKNYRIHTPCPYYPNAYANLAHGSRGLATAPICAAQIAAEICQEPTPLSQHLSQALSPNRLIIRNIIRSQNQSLLD